MPKHLPDRSLDALKRRRRALLRELNRINQQIAAWERRLAAVKKRLTTLARMRRKVA
ncbi:MAG TPA: hypothetical protein VNK04_15485 [Gemmataceae bacterium]|nr:hypothetical protein [Gemmataceae bacterium]